MKAVVFHGIGDIRLDEVKDPTIQKDQDAHCTNHGECHLRYGPS